MKAPSPKYCHFYGQDLPYSCTTLKKGRKSQVREGCHVNRLRQMCYYFSVLNEVSQVRLSLLVVAMCIVICLHPTMCRSFLYSGEQRARRSSRNTESIGHWSSNAGSRKRGCRTTTRQRGHRYLFCGDLSKRAQFLSLLSLCLWASETNQRRNFIHFIQRNEI